jgi:hypothetical protein
MAKANNQKVNSVGFWMLAILVTGLPGIGLIMTLVWAYSGGNEERRNYCRAILGWYVVFAVVWLTMLAIGLAPVTALWIQKLYDQLRAFLA